MLKLDAKLDLNEIVIMPNIAVKLSDQDLNKIAMDVIRVAKQDEDSRAKWEYETDEVLKQATLVNETKNTPYENCANVKYPLTTLATLQFASRAYPEFVRNGRTLEIKAMGTDNRAQKEARARRVGDFMNWQYLVESTEYEELVDRIFHMLPVIGHIFTKTYYDPCLKTNITELCSYKEILVNNNAKSVETVRFITHRMEKHRDWITEKIRYGEFRDLDETLLALQNVDPNKEDVQIVLEQHRYLDLDGDGYEEPYIVTVLQQSNTVARIVARFDADKVLLNANNKVMKIKPIHYFTDWIYIPSFTGSYYGIGIGHLLYGSNDAINSLFNQLLDSGRFSNLQTGIIDQGIRIKGGELKVKPGSLVKVDTSFIGALKDHIHQFDFAPPSPVLFQLLGLLIEGAKQLSSMTDVNTGTAQVQNVAQSVMATQLDQGTKVFSGVVRRIFRSLKKKFEKDYRLNRIFLDSVKYFNVMDDELAVSQQDFEEESFDICPIADPALSSDVQRVQRGTALLALLENPVAGKELNSYKVVHDYVDGMRVDNPDEYVVPPDPNATPPEVSLMLSEIQQRASQEKLDQHSAMLKEQELGIKAQVSEAEIEKLRSEALKARAEAMTISAQPRLEERRIDMDMISKVHKENTSVHREKMKSDTAKEKANKPKASE